MVCVEENTNALCIIRFLQGTRPRILELNLPSSTPVRTFVQNVAEYFNLPPDRIQLILSLPSGKDIVLQETSEESLEGSGVRTDSARNIFLLQTQEGADAQASPKAKESNGSEEDSHPLDLHPPHAESASPTTVAECTYQMASQNRGTPIVSNQYSGYNTAGLIKHDTGYVGLVNQAMTCYLNSLLQALFMTPEFRNALYKWKYDPSMERNGPSSCIPYQLQRLFLNLQTSRKSAVETTELTRSFGWDSSEAWHQHDIQELCRVMFDALEKVFKGTSQADLIDRLYQGKMIDYVKCLECGKEKSREDTFLDIPLPVRPFGSTVAYGSVVEALRGFVQPETLEGANQYFCENCEKKCDAHKGLKFSKFPYLLTLHLKRFDFDYTTMHRIKLNDKVTFQQHLDLNSFVEQQLEKEEGSEGITDSELTVGKCDDSSTTDSGSALDDETCQPTTDLTAAQDVNQDDDEGIDVSGSNGSNHHENEKNRRHGLRKGPYLYDLFSIMIHSGSASGGHYYAYIKDFTNGEWFCFNDTSVTRITDDDIAKTYGGGSLRGYYSGAYSSSTNAYMLMYRQISEDNCQAIRENEFPEHIQDLYKEMSQDNDRRSRDRLNHLRSQTKLKLFCRHPTKGMIETKLYIFQDSTLQEVTDQAYDRCVPNGIDKSDCRLVSYNSKQDTIDVSFEGRESYLFSEIMENVKHHDWLLEIKKEGEEFDSYQPGDVTVKVYVVDLEKEEVLVPPIKIRSSLCSTLAELKETIAMMNNVSISPSEMVIATQKYCYLREIEDDTLDLEKTLSHSKEVYVARGPLEKPFPNSKFYTLIDRFEHVVTLQLSLPDTDSDTLTRLSIPSLSSYNAKQAGDAATTPVDKVSTELPVKSCGSRGLMLPLILTGAGDEEGGGASCGGAGGGGGGGHSDQSTSEDSSLTDSDRTLIGDSQLEAEERMMWLNDGDNQLTTPPEDNNLPTQEEECWDHPLPPPKSYNYFKASYVSESNKILNVHVDKRMSLEAMKACLENYVGVPASCFKLFRASGCADNETPRSSRTCESLNSLKSGDTLAVRLDRQLTSDEYRIKVHQLLLNSTQPIKFLCEWIVAKGGNVGQTKKEIIDDLNKRNNLNLQYNKCRLRKKNWKNVGRVYLDSQAWVDDVTMFSNGDMFLQELSEPETVTSSSQLCLLVRHWHPSTLTLDPFFELVLDSSSFDELKQKLSEKSDIPMENIEITKPSGFFPCEMSVLAINSELEWNHKITSLESWPLQIGDDGGVIFFRDSQEELKTLTEEERKELLTKESARLSSTAGTVSTYSPRKERPLKIYLNQRPNHTSEPDVD